MNISARVVKIGEELKVEIVLPLAEVCNPDTLGAANNPEEFVLPSEGTDVTNYFANYLKLKSFC